MQIDVAQQHADRSTLRSSLLVRINPSIFHDTRFQPAPDQADQARITYSMFNKTEHPVMVEAPEEVLQVRLQHPSRFTAGDHFIEGRQSVMGTQPCPSAERAWQEVLLVDGGKNLGRAALERPVRNSWNPKRALFLFAGLRDIDAPNVWRSVSLSVDRLKHRLNPSLKALLRLLHRLTINPGGRAFRNIELNSSVLGHA